MLKSATLILEQYIDDAHWFKFHDFEQISFDVEENLYIIIVNERCFVVYETDYIVADLPKIVDEVSIVLKHRGLQPLHWLAKKSNASTTTNYPPNTVTEDNDALRSTLIYRDPETSLRYAVLEATGTKSHS